MIERGVEPNSCNQISAQGANKQELTQQKRVQEEIAINMAKLLNLEIPEPWRSRLQDGQNLYKLASLSYRGALDPS